MSKYVLPIMLSITGGCLLLFIGFNIVKPDEVTLKTVNAVILYCSDKGETDYIIKSGISSHKYRLQCKDGTNLYFNQGDVFFGPKKEN